VVSAALLCRYRQLAPRYWKPIQTGIEQDDDSAEVRRLSGCDPADVLADGIRLPRPVSPHLAAELAGCHIHVAGVAQMLTARPGERPWIVEGAGGVLVPINRHDLMVDLMARIGLAAVLVARSGLGTINHTLLTLEALDRRSIPVAGVVMVGSPNPDNRVAIERYGDVRVVGELPTLDTLGPESLQQWALDGLDVEGQIEGQLR
jgi:dethiobiotin synthetase